MANSSPSMESSRELALIDKVKARQRYCPPPICEMKYCIEDIFLHARYYFLKEKKFNKRVERLKHDEPEFNNRFRIILNCR